MTPELMITQLLGTPYAPRGNTYDALDCFGVIELWYRDVLGIDVVDRAQHPSTHQGLKDGFDQATEWIRIDGPIDHCVVVMQAGALLEGHVGVYYHGNVIHADRRHKACICQSINDRQIVPYVTGYYRHK